jgi:hypothetical protein
MSSTAAVHTSKLSTTIEVSEFEIRRPRHSDSEPERLLVAFEKVDHTYHMAACFLLGNAGEKMTGLKKWRSENMGRWQAVAALLLCKKPYIAVGRLGVSLDCRHGQESAALT